MIAFELLKLALQLGGALFIAWLTVRWALTRFKFEKSWERQLTAYADVLAALGDMRRILGIWEDYEIKGTDVLQPRAEELRQRYGRSKQRFEEAAAIAAIILPLGSAERFRKLEHELEQVREASGSFAESIEIESDLIARYQSETIDEAKKALGIGARFA